MRRVPPVRGGRPDGQAIKLLRQGLATGSRVAEVTVFPGEPAAFEAALQALHPGELVVLQADDVDATVALIQRYQASTSLARDEPPVADQFDRAGFTDSAVSPGPAILQR